MCATLTFILLATCLAAINATVAGTEFPFSEIAEIAETLPGHSITYMERAVVLDPNDDDSSIFSQTIFHPHTSQHEDDVSEIDFEIGTARMWHEPDYENESEQEKAARALAKEYDRFATESRAQTMLATWNYASNLTAENYEISRDINERISAEAKEWVPRIKAFNRTIFKDPFLHRQFEFMKRQGYNVLPAEKLQKLMGAINKMSDNYGKVRICSYQDPKKCDLQLEPELTMILKTSRDPKELQYYWEEWYDKAGTPNRKYFDEYVKLRNEAAQLNGFESGAEMWIQNYDDPTFEDQLDAIFLQMRPLFEELHTYVRHALSLEYGEEIVPADEPIPMHLLGNMWAQSWGDVDKFATPFPRLKLPDITEEMHRQNYTIPDIYKMAERFFVSMGLPKMTKLFWKNSIIEKPPGRDMICHASAWDMSNGTDYRIKECTRINIQDVFVVHHEMGHVEYFMLYKDQPAVFRGSANDGFHEAIGDMIALSVMTPKYLHEIGLMKEMPTSKGAKINQLFRMALEKVVSLQFVYALESFRYEVFRGEIDPEEYNCEYWEYMLRVLGVKPPVTRYAEDFDPPAKYHVSSDVEYARYMVAGIIQFQIQKAMCELTGDYEPNTPGKMLSDCSLYGSKEAGSALRNVLSLGSSVPWPDQLEMLTGSRTLDASAMWEYFQPLYLYLVKTNRENGLDIGWNSDRECDHRP